MPDDPRSAGTAEIDLPFGSRALVVSDLFLTATPTEASASASREVALAIDDIEGPGAVIFAGNLFELLGSPLPDPAAALAAHGELAEAMARFARHEQGLCRHLVVLPGSRDRAILFDPQAQAALEQAGATVVLQVDLRAETLAGTRSVRVDPG